MVEPIRKHNGCNQAPAINAVADPRTNNLDPARPIASSHRRKILGIDIVDILRQERRNPARS